MQVLKFGGSSVASATRLSGVLDIVGEALLADRVILVSSAISGCTDCLIEIGRRASSSDRSCFELIKALRKDHGRIICRLFTGSERVAVEDALDRIFADLTGLVEKIHDAGSITEEQAEYIQTFGELLSTTLIAAKLSTEHKDVLWIDSRELIVKGDEQRTFKAIRKAMESHPVVNVFVAPGFIARDAEGRVCTLGRGGSDYTAALYAAATGAGTLQIWTDVPGIMSSNPKVVPTASTIGRMSYESALCMAEHGAKVLYAPTVAPAMNAGIPINIRNTFDPKNPGTTIEFIPRREECRWLGVSNMPYGDVERICLTAEGPVDVAHALKRACCALREAGIEALSTGEEAGCITMDVRASLMKDACNAVHKEFFEQAEQTVVDIYVAGYGAVGHALETLVKSGVSSKNGRKAHIVAITSDHGFVDDVLKRAPRRSVFVDCTDSEDLHLRYVDILEAGINIVSSNRRSFCVPYVEYAAMKQAALRNGCFIRYDTTVGNALPILESIAGGALLGEELESIEAVVSCTLNHIITGYDGANTESMATLLRKAQSAGLTETDPRFDLGGRDALRKLLIIAREAGIPLEEDDVKITPMLSQSFFDCSLDDFYQKLAASEPDFIRKEAELDSIGKRQRFVASLYRDRNCERGYRAEIKMHLVGEDSPFYWIRNTENVIVIKSAGTAPLIIRGAGEGAREAASGVLNDILK